RQAAANSEYRVWCGTAGLAACVPAALGLTTGANDTHRQPVRRSPAERVLVISGSPHPATAIQIRTLVEAGWTLLAVDASLRDEPPRVLPERLARELHRSGRAVISLQYGNLSSQERAALAHEPGAAERLLRPILQAVQDLPLTPGLGFIITGGETAVQVCRALGATAIHVAGEALPGIPLGVLDLPQGTFPIATKSGGFGGPDALLKTAEALTSPRREVKSP
ncbi:MAG: nucleotide-binding domain containing protein, partial [Chloroflexota bacterium]